VKAALVLAALALPVPALAQAYQCAPPGRIGALPRPQPDGPARRTPVGRYTLAVSWSPEYCRSDRDPASVQCSGRHGRFGFVLHGLWPEASRGPAPQWCSINPRPSPQTLRANLCMTPVARLLEHEWAKHGSCMARTPADYFATASRLWRGLRWPDADRLSRQDSLTVGDLRRAVALANPEFAPGQIGVVVNARGWLRELRLCYTRTWRPMSCPARTLGPRDSAPLKIWRGI
jgi:ribonuclease T2